MSREQIHESIILRQTAFGEADEIITFYTRDLGKVRALAKAVKLSSSKLRHGLQPMFLVSVTLTATSKLPKIIGVQTKETFGNVAEEHERLSHWFVAAELINRATADEQKNEELFDLLRNFLELLNRKDIPSSIFEQLLVKFKLELLGAIGLGIWHPADPETQPGYFSNSKGGFMNTRVANDAVPVSKTAWEAYIKLRDAPLNDLASEHLILAELPQLVGDFTTYYLEREIKSEKFLGAL